ncbi:hypothetical protein FOMPIDRAFT_1119342 [Fomitopsis schrenkii]|uniref:Peptidase A1 domain-containing protein n=1 Tax=Fomitopsis schrenkii TaxID=2126942 RepID=S8EFM6_FOMSC|nr:hypothetical protein FOMPIDRAFT_1119342 [Fomitopsis schrenkii]
MIARLSIFLALLCVLAATATPLVWDASPVTIPLTKKLNFTSGVTLVQSDKARIQSIVTDGTNDKSNAARAVVNTAATNRVVNYIANVGVGTPPTEYTLIVDTSSANTWVGASKAYVVTSTSEDTGEPVSVTYGSGSFSGTEYLDTVTLGTGLAITQQSIGVASSATGLGGVDGILGPASHSPYAGTLTNNPTTQIPTIVQNAFAQGRIPVAEIGIAFTPTTVATDINGVVTYGGVDSSYHTGAITYTPITALPESSKYVGITQSVSYGTTPLFAGLSGIIDTSTALLYFPTAAYATYAAETGAELDTTTGLLRITPAQYDDLSDLTFTVGNATYSFTLNAQIWPRSLNTAIGGTSEYVYLIVSDIGVLEGLSGIEFISGMTWLERYYFVYNSGSNEVGFATTSHTSATTN